MVAVDKPDANPHAISTHLQSAQQDLQTQADTFQNIHLAEAQAAHALAAQEQPQHWRHAPETADQIARALIERATSTDTMYNASVDGVKVGAGIASIARTDPAKAADVYNQAMHILTPQQRQRELALAIGDGRGPERLRHDELRTIASHHRGRAMLCQAAKLLRGVSSANPAEMAAVRRIDVATAAADLGSKLADMQLDAGNVSAVLETISRYERFSPLATNVAEIIKTRGFHGASRYARNEIVATLAYQPDNDAFAHNLSYIVNDAGFLALDDGAKSKFFRLAGSDRDFTDATAHAMRSEDYLLLTTPDDRRAVLEGVMRIPATRSYNVQPSANGKPRRDIELASRSQQNHLIIWLLGVSMARTMRMSNDTILKNTIIQILNNHTNAHFYTQKPSYTPQASPPTHEVGFYSSGSTVYINLAHKGIDDAIETLCHEVNHRLNNDPTPMPSAERFLSEYRAWIVGREGSTGMALTAPEQRGIVDDILRQTGGYSALGKWYASKSDAIFNKVVDNLISKLDAGRTVSPEELRNIFVWLYGDDRKPNFREPGNIDNCWDNRLEG